MTRRQSLSSAQIHQARAAYIPHKFGYGAVAELIGAPVSTVRDALCGYTAYATLVEARIPTNTMLLNARGSALIMHKEAA